MPLVQLTPTQLWAHCPNNLCAGNAPKLVAGVARETTWTYQDNGGDIPGVESSDIAFDFADPRDADCAYCAEAQAVQGFPPRRRDLSDRPRPEYEPLAQGLAGLAPPDRLAEPGTDLSDVVAAQGEQIERLTAALEAQSTNGTPRPAPKGRPKETDE